MALWRFLPGILVLESATAALVYAMLLPGAQQAFWLPAAVLGGGVTLLTAFWFGSIAEHIRKDAVQRAGSLHARERETLVITAEADKRAALEQNHQRLLKATARAQAQANWRLGMRLAGLLALGGVLLAVEFMTVGLLVMAAAGGALGGYLLRARQTPRWLPDATVPVLTSQRFEVIEAPGRSRRRSGY